MGASPSEIRAVYDDRYPGFRHAVSAVVGSHDAAYDVVQDGFALALARRRQYRGGSLEAWIWQIVRGKALDAVRGRPLEPLVERFGPELLRSDRDPELVEAVRALAPRRRLVVFLRYWADLSYREIAELCDVSEGTVAATLAQAREELRGALTPEGAKR